MELDRRGFFVRRPFSPSGTRAMRALITERLSEPPATKPPPRAGLREAAVLVPLLERPEGMSLLLVERTQHLRHHAGQVSLPGGRIESSDTDALAAALRETEEEIGVARDRVEVIGELEPVETITGFRITPFVGFLPTDARLRPDPYEVESTFEIPLDVALRVGGYELHTRRVNDVPISYYTLDYDGHTIWGATARILVNFARRLGIAENA